MPRCIDQIENVFFSVFCFVNGTDSLGFDRDPAFSLQIHIIEHLRLHLTACQQSRLLNDPVCQRRFSVIDMCNNAKISDFTLIYS